jgi:predicted TIM-barrel fold metal-dependent hydrolase
MTSMKYERISVGSHVNPPPSMWAERLPAKYRERAPKIVHRKHPQYGEIEMLAFEGKEMPFNFISADAGVRSEDAKPIGKSFLDGQRGGWDPVVRIDDQKRDGVDAEVLLDGVTMLATPDRELKAAMIRAYNDWLADYCKHAPERFLGVAYLPVWDSALAVAEAERASKLGLRGALIPSIPGIETPYSMPADKQFNDPFWDPLWSPLESLAMPAHMHVDLGTLSKEFYSDTIVLMCANKTMYSEPIAIFCCTGVLERHPKLKLVTVESGVGWMAFFVPWMDLVFERHRYYTGYELKEKPSYYFHRQVYGSYIQDLVGVRNRDVIGVENILWCNDFPHVDGIWPNSSASIEEHMAGVPAAERHAILAGNAVKLYGL